MRKKIIVVVVVLFSFVLIPVFAQQQADISDKVLKRLGFSANEIESITKVYEETQKTVMNAKAEIDIYRAELKKLLLSSDVDMIQVEKLLRKSLEWELKMRLAQIEREVKIRKLVGDRKWARLVQYFRRLRMKNIEIRKAHMENPRVKEEGVRRLSDSREKRIKMLIKELERLLSEKSGR